MKYTVILDVRVRGSSCGTTDDIIEADSAEQAERQGEFELDKGAVEKRDAVAAG